jgi:AraC-like DNA-binding protein
MCEKSAAMASMTTSQIAWPRAALAGCIYCAIVRDTRGVALDHAERFNFFPASPLCSVIRIFAGEWYRIDQPDQMECPWTGVKLPRLAFSGVQHGPAVSWNPGETYAVTLAFYPDALSAMTGLDLGQFTGRIMPAEDVLPPAILELCSGFFEAVAREGLDGSWADFENRIEVLWSGVDPAGTKSKKRITDWSARLALKAALAGSGRSARQIARRVKSWTGISERDLQSLGHSEQLYAKMHEAMQTGDLVWAELAAASGFADQAHMIRQMRRHTGFTPERLRQRARSDEAFWGYRLLGQYWKQQEGQ